jgi:transposase
LKSLAAPANITLVPPPAYSLELNPVDRVWLYLKERFLSHRLLDDYDATADATSKPEIGSWRRPAA